MSARTAKGRVGGCLYLFLIGGFLLLLGAWFALAEAGFGVPSIEAAWPVFPLFGGCCFLLGYLLERRNFGLVLPGSMAAMVGLFFFPFSFGVLQWSAMETLWPVFPLIGGLSFVAMWLAAFGRYIGLLIPAFLGISVGVVGLAFTLTPFGGLVERIGWPVAFLAVGASLLLLTAALVVRWILGVFLGD